MLQTDNKVILLWGNSFLAKLSAKRLVGIGIGIGIVATVTVDEMDIVEPIGILF
ncbi:hypothetical protein [Shewanella sp.]|uniref:hypothetical protein n=1 Tax=Shewanella sp. TaxID=50422 RepID=UPI002607C003|nr:hypothetical protein [Shewanella sp.]